MPAVTSRPSQASQALGVSLQALSQADGICSASAQAIAPGAILGPKGAATTLRLWGLCICCDDAQALFAKRKNCGEFRLLGFGLLGFRCAGYLSKVDPTVFQYRPLVWKP